MLYIKFNGVDKMKKIYKDYEIVTYYDDDFASYYFSLFEESKTGLGRSEEFFDGIGMYMCTSELEAISKGKKFIDEMEIKKKDLKFQKGTDILEQILELKKYKNEIEKEVIKTDFSSLMKKVIYSNLKEINLKTKKLNKKFKELTGVEFL